MTLASLFRPAPVVPSGGRHAAPDTGAEDSVVAVLDARPGRHAAPDADDPAAPDPAAPAAPDAADQPAEDSGDLLDALGFAYDD